jgi:hypothetical protein
LKILHITNIDFNFNVYGIGSVIMGVIGEREVSESALFLLYKSELINKRLAFDYYFNNNSRSFLELLDKINWDLIVFHSCFDKHFYSFYKQIQIKKVPYIITSHGCFMKNVYKKNPLKKYLYKFLFLDKFVRDSKGIVFNLENEHKNSYYNNKSYVVIPNVIDYHTSFNIQPNNIKLKLISISRIDLYYKKIDLFIKSLEVVKEDLQKIDFSYEIYGLGDEKDIKKLEKEISSSCFRDNIFFKGAIYDNDKIKKLNESDIFIQMSSSESMSLGITEALSCAVPCFVSDMTNLEDDFDRFHCGWVTKLERDEMARYFLEAIKCYMANKTMYRKNARRYAEHYFEIGKNFDKYALNKYKELLEG